MFGVTAFAEVPFAASGSASSTVVASVSGVSATGEVGAAFILIQQWDLIPISQTSDWITINTVADQLVASDGILITTESGDILCVTIYDTNWTQITANNTPNWTTITYN